MGGSRCHCVLRFLRAACPSDMGQRLRPCSHAACFPPLCREARHRSAVKKEFSIHYDLVEQFIPDEIKKKVDSSKEGTAGCPTIACPDLEWKVSFKSGFAFTEKGQPEISPVGENFPTASV